jgi:hypothetical protein
MSSYSTILQHVHSLHEIGETIQAAHYVLDMYNLNHPNFKGFELRERAKPEYILMTTEGTFGLPQIIRIPENAFEFEFKLILNLLAHEMVHVIQKTPGYIVMDKNEREWQAYYEILFHTNFPLVPDVKPHHKKFFGNKGLEYYNRMEKDGELQLKYASQKAEVESLIASLT